MIKEFNLVLETLCLTRLDSQVYEGVETKLTESLTAVCLKTCARIQCS